MRYAKVDHSTGQIAEILDEGARQPAEDDRHRIVQVGDSAKVGDQAPGEGQGGRPATPPGQEGEQPGNRPDTPPGQEKPRVEPR
jgi:hypothetical protein